MVELGCWTVVNVMYVEYVFVGHGLIDYTLPIARTLSVKNAWSWVSMDFT